MNYQELVELYQKTCQERDEARANYKWLADRQLMRSWMAIVRLGQKQLKQNTSLIRLHTTF